MKFRDHYDWVVLGDHPGALLSAGLVARLGLSVLILPFIPSMRTLVSKSGQVLDPESNLLLGLGKVERSSGLLSDCLTKLGIVPAESEKIRRGSVFPQVLTPGRRLSFAEDDEILRNELDREFGLDFSKASGILQAMSRSEAMTLGVWKRFPERLTLSATKTRVKSDEPQSIQDVKKRLRNSARGSKGPDADWFETRSTTGFLERKTKKSGLNEVLEGLWFGIASTPGNDASLMEWTQLMCLGRTAASFRGGMTAYREFLLNLAKRHGAHVLQKGECRRLFVEGSRFIGVQVAQQGSMISVEGGILGCSLSQAKEHISWSGRRWLNRLKSAPQVEGWRFTLSLLVDAEAIPPGASRRMVWNETGAPILEVEIADPTEYESNPTDRKLIFLRTLLPFRQESLDVEYLRVVSARMVRQLSEIFPFSEAHIQKVYPDFRVPGSELSETFGFAAPELIPENLRCTRGQGIGSRSGIESLFVSTGESYPELGSFGPTVAALEATAWIAHRCGLTGPFA